MGNCDLPMAWLEDRDSPSITSLNIFWEDWKTDEFKLRFFVFFVLFMGQFDGHNYSYKLLV
jgi:hypothetical protein